MEAKKQVGGGQVKAEILKVVSAVNTLVLFFCPCCANFFWSVYAAGKDETAGIGIF